MEIDIHFAATYAIARLAGFEHKHAEIVATASQYVDDTVNRGVLLFKTGQAYYRMCTAHKVYDRQLYHRLHQRLVWVPFHFLPGDRAEGHDEDKFYHSIVCRAGSPVAEAMVVSCIQNKHRPFTLHQLGITAHVFMDTWAHQGFAGVRHQINLASDIKLLNPAEDPKRRGFCEFDRPYVCRLLGRCFPMGHGTVFHYPDHPFRKWSYVDGHGKLILRDNPADFLVAAEALYGVFRRYLAGGLPSGGCLPAADKAVIEEKIRNLQDDDGEARNRQWLQAIRQGKFSFGPANPEYLSFGPGSWKYKAFGAKRAKTRIWQTFDYYCPGFLESDWKLFHDAAQAHQFEVLRTILPDVGICAI